MAFPERKYGKVAGRDKGEVRAGPGSGSDSGVSGATSRLARAPGVRPGPLVPVPRDPRFGFCFPTRSKGEPRGTEKDGGRGGKREKTRKRV